MNIPRSSLRTGRQIINYEGNAVIELQFYHFPDDEIAVAGSSQTK